jgi:hypothetical protein
LKKLEFLFEKRSGEDFFKEVDKLALFHHDLSQLIEKKQFITDEILQPMK